MSVFSDSSIWSQVLLDQIEELLNTDIALVG